MTDREAIQACMEGDANSFKWIVDRYKIRAFNSALIFTGDREDALDLSQEAFVRAYRAIKRFDLNRSFFTWYYQILKHLCINHLNAKRRRHYLSLDDPEYAHVHPMEDGAGNPEDIFEASERSQLLWKAIDQLDRADREILLMKEFQDFSYKEISEALDIPIGTVMSRLYYARKKLIKRLGTLYA